MSSPFPIYELHAGAFPPLLREIPQPPKILNYRGQLPPPEMKLITVVGSRKYSTYGKQVVEHLISGLRGYNVGIVSGLALGIDSLAHEAALRHNLYTLAVPGSGLNADVIYPATHKPLARLILQSGGGLLSEFEPTFRATMWSFTQRNRLMAGIAEATLVIEASERSGTLITARMAADYNRELLVVPGNIFSQNSSGAHQFLKLGATPVTHAQDILHALRIDPQSAPQSAKMQLREALTEVEQKILNHLQEPIDKDSLIRNLKLEAKLANTLLMQLEIKGFIANENNQYRINT
jgi:DNA processing protein